MRFPNVFHTIYNSFLQKYFLKRKSYCIVVSQLLLYFSNSVLYTISAIGLEISVGTNSTYEQRYSVLINAHSCRSASFKPGCWLKTCTHALGWTVNFITKGSSQKPNREIYGQATVRGRGGHPQPDRKHL